MQAIRSILYIVAQIIITPLYAVLLVLVSPLPRKPRFRIVIGWTWFFTWLADKLCGVRYQIIGKENVPTDTQLMVVAKHASTWETLALSFLFQPASFIAKRELLWVPFFGWGFATASPITINRSAGSEAMAQMVKQGVQRAKDGFNIVIFPEGTRIPAGHRGKYKSGFARLATGIAKAGTSIAVLPIAHNAGYLWPKKGFMKYPGVVTLSILPPIVMRGDEDATALTQRVEAMIEEEVARLGDPRVNSLSR